MRNFTLLCQVRRKFFHENVNKKINKNNKISNVLSLYVIKKEDFNEDGFTEEEELYDDQ